ncbi:hypothetical protein FVEN_g8157 [Fusarium venenatum]|nr:hypothetical protein FVEN_g8157 [Fusarium venenatum]
MPPPRAMTFTGCWTCKVRKVACDKRPIACKNCEKRGVTCGGYGIKLQWVSDSLAEARTNSRYQGRRALKLDQTYPVHESETIDMFLSHIDLDTQEGSSSRQGPFSVFSVREISPPEMDMSHTISESSPATTISQYGELLYYNQLKPLVEHHVACQLPQSAVPDLYFDTEILLSSEPSGSSFELFSGVEYTSTSTSLTDQVPAIKCPLNQQSSIAEANSDKTNSQNTSVVETGITQFRLSEAGSVANYQILMMAILSLVTIGVLSGEGEEFRLHIEAATQLRNARSRWKLMSRPSQQLNQVGTFLALLSRTMLFKPSSLPWRDSNEQATAAEDEAIQSSACYEYIYGIKPSIAVAINRACRLAEHLLRVREEGEQQIPDTLLEGCEELGDMLESWRLKEESPTPISSDDDLGVLIFTHQAKAWYAAALIYYYTRIQGAQPTDLIQEVTAVAEHMYAMEDIKSRLGVLIQDNPMAPITWPAFVASCNALGDMRQVWRTWWERMQCYKIGNITKQWSVVQMIWEILDIGKNRGAQIDWTKAYDEVGICILAV